MRSCLSSTPDAGDGVAGPGVAFEQGVAAVACECFVVAVFDQGCPCVPEEFLGQVLLGEAVSAEELDRVVGVVQAEPVAVILAAMEYSGKPGAMFISG